MGEDRARHVGAEDMIRRPRSNHSPASNAKVVIETLGDGRMVAEIAQKHDVHLNQVTKWRRQPVQPCRGDHCVAEDGHWHKGLTAAIAPLAQAKSALKVYPYFFKQHLSRNVAVEHA